MTRRFMPYAGSFLTLLLVLNTPMVMFAQNESSNSPADAKDETALPQADINAWIKQLDDNSFEIREDATRKLIAGGSAVVPHVEAGVGDVSLEVSSRCLRVLESLFRGDDVDAQADAAISLKRLAGSKKPSVARKAANILDGDKKVDQQNLIPGNLIPNAGFNRRRLPGGVGVNRRMQVTNTNGHTQVDVTEGEKKIQISHRNRQNITVEVTEPGKEGKPATRRSEAKNLEELKKDHPEAADLFEQFSGDKPLGLNAGNFPPGLPIPGLQDRVRARAVPPKARLERERRNSKAELTKVQEQLGRITSKLKSFSDKGESNPEELRKIVDELNQIQESVKSTGEELSE